MEEDQSDLQFEDQTLETDQKQPQTGETTPAVPIPLPRRNKMYTTDSDLSDWETRQFGKGAIKSPPMTHKDSESEDYLSSSPGSKRPYSKSFDKMSFEMSAEEATLSPKRKHKEEGWHPDKENKMPGNWKNSVSSHDSALGGSLFSAYGSILTESSDSLESESNSEESSSLNSSPIHNVYGRYTKIYSDRPKEHNSIMQDEIETLVLHRLPGENIGMILGIEGGNYNDSVSAVTVKTVTIGGAAYRATGGSKGVTQGDQILEVNGMDLRKMKKDECMTVLREMPLRVILTIKRGTKQFPTPTAGLTELRQKLKRVSSRELLEHKNERFMQNYSTGMTTSESEDDNLDGFAFHHVEIDKNPKESLGISIVPSYGSTREYYQVKRLLPSGAGSRSGQLKVGDRLVSCNGRSLRNLTQAKCLSVLKTEASSGDLELEVLRQDENETPMEISLKVENGLGITALKDSVVTLSPSYERKGFISSEIETDSDNDVVLNSYQRHNGQGNSSGNHVYSINTGTINIPVSPRHASSDVSDDPGEESDYSLKSQHQKLINSKMSTSPFGVDDTWGVALPPPAEFSDDAGMTSEVGTSDENVPTTNIDDILSDYAPSLSNQESDNHHHNNDNDEPEFDDFITDNKKQRPEALSQIQESNLESNDVKLLESNPPFVDRSREGMSSSNMDKQTQNHNQIIDVFDSYLTSGDETDGSLSSNINHELFQVPENHSEDAHRNKYNPRSRGQEWPIRDKGESADQLNVYNTYGIPVTNNACSDDDDVIVPISVKREMSAPRHWVTEELPETSVDDAIIEDAIVPNVIEREKRVALKKEKEELRDDSPPRVKIPPRPKPRPRKSVRSSDSDEVAEETLTPVVIQKDNSANVLDSKLSVSIEEDIVPQVAKRDNAWNYVPMMVMANKWAKSASSNKPEAETSSGVTVQVVQHMKEDSNQQEEDLNVQEMILPQSQPPQMLVSTEREDDFVDYEEDSTNKYVVNVELPKSSPPSIPDAGLNIFSKDSKQENDPVKHKPQTPSEDNVVNINLSNEQNKTANQKSLYTDHVTDSRTDNSKTDLNDNTQGNVSVINVVQENILKDISREIVRDVLKKSQDSFDEAPERVQVHSVLDNSKISPSSSPLPSPREEVKGDSLQSSRSPIASPKEEVKVESLQPSRSPIVSPRVERVEVKGEQLQPSSPPKSSPREEVKSYQNEVKSTPITENKTEKSDTPSQTTGAQYKTVVPVTTKPQSLLKTIRSSAVQMKPLSSIKPVKIDMKSFKPAKYSTTISATGTKPSLLSTLHGSSLDSGAKSTRSEDAPFQVSVLKGILGLGIKVKVTPEGFVQVSEVQPNGPIAKDGNIKAGDYILAINSTEMIGLQDGKVQQILRLLPRGLAKIVASVSPPSDGPKTKGGEQAKEVEPLRTTINVEPTKPAPFSSTQTIKVDIKTSPKIQEKGNDKPPASTDEKEPREAPIQVKGVEKKTPPKVAPKPKFVGGYARMIARENTSAVSDVIESDSVSSVHSAPPGSSYVSSAKKLSPQNEAKESKEPIDTVIFASVGNSKTDYISSAQRRAGNSPKSEDGLEPRMIPSGHIDFVSSVKPKSDENKSGSISPRKKDISPALSPRSPTEKGNKKASPPRINSALSPRKNTDETTFKFNVPSVIKPQTKISTSGKDMSSNDLDPSGHVDVVTSMSQSNLSPAHDLTESSPAIDVVVSQNTSEHSTLIDDNISSVQNDNINSSDKRVTDVKVEIPTSNECLVPTEEGKKSSELNASVEVMHVDGGTKSGMCGVVSNNDDITNDDVSIKTNQQTFNPSALPVATDIAKQMVADVDIIIDESSDCYASTNNLGSSDNDVESEENPLTDSTIVPPSDFTDPPSDFADGNSSSVSIHVDVPVEDPDTTDLTSNNTVDTASIKLKTPVEHLLGSSMYKSFDTPYCHSLPPACSDDELEVGDESFSMPQDQTNIDTNEQSKGDNSFDISPQESSGFHLPQPPDEFCDDGVALEDDVDGKSDAVEDNIVCDNNAVNEHVPNVNTVEIAETGFDTPDSYRPDITLNVEGIDSQNQSLENSLVFLNSEQLTLPMFQHRLRSGTDTPDTKSLGSLDDLSESEFSVVKSRRRWSLLAGPQELSMYAGGGGGSQSSEMSLEESSLIPADKLTALLDDANDQMDQSGFSMDDEIMVVILHNQEKTTHVGLQFQQDHNEQATISSVDPNGLAGMDDRVRVGDILLSVNGELVKSTNVNRLMDKMEKKTSHQIVLVVSKNKVPMETPPPLPESIAPSEEVVPEVVPEVKPHLFEEPKNISPVVNGEKEIATPAVDDIDNKSPPSLNDKSVIVHDLDDNQNQTKDGEPDGDVMQLTMMKGVTGLGFLIEGGKASARGDQPLTIKRIFKGGSADKCGVLMVKDELLTVNGEDVTKMKHSEAWQFLKFLDEGAVQLLIRRKTTLPE